MVQTKTRLTFIKMMCLIVQKFGILTIAYMYAGDWNLVLDQNMDTLNYLHNNNINARKSLLTSMESLGLVDIWRQHNPYDKKFTWFKKVNHTPVKCARLDFFLISESLEPFVNSCKVEPAILTDHSIVSLSIDFSKIIREKGFWKFNNSLLKDTGYI